MTNSDYWDARSAKVKQARIVAEKEDLFTKLISSSTSTITKFNNDLLGYPPVPKRSFGNTERIIRRLPANRMRMLENSSHWPTGHFENRDLLGKTCDDMDQGCDRRLARLTSYIHHIGNYRQYCHVGNKASECTLGLFQDADFAGDLTDSNPTSGAVYCAHSEVTHLCPFRGHANKQTNSRFAQQHQSRYHFIGCWSVYGRYLHIIRKRKLKPDVKRETVNWRVEDLNHKP